MKGPIVRVGSRGSKLALAQAQEVLAMLRGAHPAREFEVVVIRTAGDKLTNVALWKTGTKGFFTAELEAALLDRRIDIAIHSMKDLPTATAAGLRVAAVTRRKDPHDVLVSPRGLMLTELAAGTVVGTSSLRRRAQLLAVRRDLEVRDIRGNVETRIRKMQDGQYGAVLLARAGLARLALKGVCYQVLPFSIFLPAPGQGALACEAREDDAATSRMLRVVNDPLSARAVKAERALLAALGAGCRAPMAALASYSGGLMRLQAMVSDRDGLRITRQERTGEPSRWERLVDTVVTDLIRSGALDLIAEDRKREGPAS